MYTHSQKAKSQFPKPKVLWILWFWELSFCISWTGQFPKMNNLMGLIMVIWDYSFLGTGQFTFFHLSTPTSHSPLHLPYFPQFYHLLHLTQVLPSSSSFRNVQRSSFSTFLPCCTGSRDLCTTCAERYLMTDLVPLAGYYLAGTAPRASKIHG